MLFKVLGCRVVEYIASFTASWRVIPIGQQCGVKTIIAFKSLFFYECMIYLL